MYTPLLPDNAPSINLNHNLSMPRSALRKGGERRVLAGRGPKGGVRIGNRNVDALSAYKKCTLVARYLIANFSPPLMTV